MKAEDMKAGASSEVAESIIPYFPEEEDIDTDQLRTDAVHVTYSGHSDHVPQFFYIPELSIGVYSTNIYFPGNPAGSDRLKILASNHYSQSMLEGSGGQPGHLEKHVLSFQKMASQLGDNRIDIIAIQEGPMTQGSIEYNHFLEALATHLKGWLVVAQGDEHAGVWTLIREERLELIDDTVYDAQDEERLKNNPTEAGRSSLKLRIKNTGKIFNFNNVHCTGARTHEMRLKNTLIDTGIYDEFCDLQPQFFTDADFRRLYLSMLHRDKDITVSGRITCNTLF